MYRVVFNFYQATERLHFGIFQPKTNKYHLALVKTFQEICMSVNH